MAAWDSEEISVDESSVIIFSNNCTFIVEVVHFCGRQHIQPLEWRLTKSSQSKSIHNPGVLSIQKALTIHEARPANGSSSDLVRSSKTCVPSFSFSVPCKSLGFRWEPDCVKYFHQDSSHTVTTPRSKRRWFCMVLGLIVGNHNGGRAILNLETSVVVKASLALVPCLRQHGFLSVPSLSRATEQSFRGLCTS